MKVIVTGALGKMGGILSDLVVKAADLELAAKVDCFSKGGEILKDVSEFKGEADMVIDFSHHSLTPALLDWCRANKKPLVLCTTGHDEAEKAQVRAAAKEIPLFFSANMSLGIALLCKMARETAKAFPDADIEIVEAHHNRKLDAPSGTALLVAGAIREARPDMNLVLGRSGMAKRQKNDVGVSALRMGNLAGMHEVIVTTETQSLTLKHEVYDRALFAEGAIEAARFLSGKPAGLYDMKDMVK